MTRTEDDEATLTNSLPASNARGFFSIIIAHPNSHRIQINVRKGHWKLIIDGFRNVEDGNDFRNGKFYPYRTNIFVSIKGLAFLLNILSSTPQNILEP